LSNNNLSKVNLDDIKTVEMPPGIQKTPLQRASEEYEKAKSEGKVNPDGTLKDAPKEKEKEEPKSENWIRDLLVTKTEYKIQVNGKTETFKRHDTTPLEYERLMELIDFHTRMVAEIQNLERRRILYQHKLKILERSLGDKANIDAYDQTLHELDAIYTRFKNQSWELDGRKFESAHQFNTYLYQKTLEFCIKMTEEQFNNSGMRGNNELAQNDTWGTKQVAEACIDVEIHTYAYFQKPSKSSSES
jgi:hypothetical protein